MRTTEFMSFSVRGSTCFSSMSSSFPKNGSCESSQFKGKGQGAQRLRQGDWRRVLAALAEQQEASHA